MHLGIGEVVVDALHSAVLANHIGHAAGEGAKESAGNAPRLAHLVSLVNEQLEVDLRGRHKLILVLLRARAYTKNLSTLTLKIRRSKNIQYIIIKKDKVRIILYFLSKAQTSLVQPGLLSPG